MNTLVIRGGKPLWGVLHMHGAKNSILPILAASVLCPGRSVITRCPELSDVAAAMEILSHLGGSAERLGDAVVVDAKNACKTQIPGELMTKMRASVNFLGALLGRFGEGELTYPGGCTLGKRPIDYHISALKTLGVTMEEQGDRLHFSWKHRRGGEVFLPFPSVGATENLLLAAVTVPAETVIHNAAREPEVEDLCGYLTAMGAEISGAGTGTIHIRGGKSLHGTAYCVIPDRIETATYLSMVAACGGHVTLKNTEGKYLLPVLDTLHACGAKVTAGDKEISLESTGALLAPAHITTAAYPGFPTDMQAPMMACLLRAKGETLVEETVFPQRFRHVEELRKFGADIYVEGGRARIRGVEKLHGAEVSVPDLRGGAGLVTAALQTMEESRIYNCELLKRGYADLLINLRLLGADVTYD